MAIIRPAIRSLLKSTVQSSISGIFESDGRYFTKFDDVAASHIALSSSLILDSTQPWEISFSCQATETPDSDGFRVFSSQAGDSLKIFNTDATNPNLIRLRQDVHTAQFFDAMAGVGRTSLNLFRVVNNSEGVISVYINEAFIDAISTTATSYTIDYIGYGPEFSDDADGIMGDIKIWTGGDRETGSLVFDMPIDKKYTSTNTTVLDKSGNGNHGTFINLSDDSSEKYTQISNGDWVGVDLFTQEAWESAEHDEAWTYNAENNTWSLVGDGSYQALVVIQSQENPPHSVLEGELLEVSGGVLAVAESGASLAEAGPYSFDLDYSENSRQVFKRGTGSITATLAKPTLRSSLEAAYHVEATRYFTTFDDVAQSHFTLSSAISLTGDFDISVEVSAPYDGARMILGNIPSQACLFVNNGNVSIRDTVSTTVSSTGEPVIASQLNTIRAVKTAGNVEIFVNDVSVAVGALGDFLVDRVGVRFADNLPFNGIIANLSVSNAGATVLDMPIDGDYTAVNNTVIDRASGNNASFLNVADGDSKAYLLINGKWVDADGQILEIA